MEGREGEEEEDDEYVKRIKRTGCYEAHLKLLECHYETKDFRQVVWLLVPVAASCCQLLPVVPNSLLHA